MSVPLELHSHFSTCSTPACPPNAKPYTYGRPTMTALAPSARALAMSAPQRMPESNTGSAISQKSLTNVKLVSDCLGYLGEHVQRSYTAVNLTTAV